jgi:L-alanine-DL-glutamate epimerase-like enolase superfamily enzyme
VEQPVPPRDVEGLALLKQSSPVSVAADESIASLADAWRLLDDDACDAFVLKPMVLGSLAECARFVSTAHERWKQVVFTSLLDSAVGRHAVAQLVASMPELAQYHHGLATGTLLLSDLHADDIAGGVLRLPEGAGLGFDPDLSTCTRLPGIPS